MIFFHLENGPRRTIIRFLLHPSKLAGIWETRKDLPGRINQTNPSIIFWTCAPTPLQMLSFCCHLKCLSMPFSSI